jgi:ADP-heptose:LPS heptosyltransferase
MILIAPFAKSLISGKQNPKNYPFWEELLEAINEPVIQVGIDGEEQFTQDFRKNLPISELRVLLQQCKTWIACDSFFQHLAWDAGKPGVVLWSVSDPLIYGHPENVNLLKSRACLAENQFLWWEYVEHDPEKFVQPDVVLQALQHFNVSIRDLELVSSV